MMLAAGALIVLATAVLTVPGRRLPRECRAAEPAAAAASGHRRGAGVLRAWRSGRRTPTPVGAILVEVAARLRTGAAVQTAWQETSRRHGDLPGALRELAGPSGGRPEREPRGEGGPRADAAAGALAAVRMAERLGAPLADVLESCARGVAESEEAAAGRRTALAAPRATARLLGWLPLAGVLLGVALGVDPLPILLDGGWGTACLLGGVVLMVVGHRWTKALVGIAERTGS
ncbi:hypothetical protein LQF12_01980 [Ruania suaedae]|uniref:type II secretion system F family protein n=1 Tax=Ruania suaedae TaxID=2897774 RepID=UPI001E369A13|nr:hypothetical protein [Ruania suaedae]UFU03402.1 hypothetical protein LQF12_01980 [Ruania suaedae]